MNLLTKISNERILHEFKNIFKNKYQDKALKMLLDAGIEVAFPELHKGLELLGSKQNYSLNYLEFFAMCLYLKNIDIPNNWRFSNKEKAIIYKTLELLEVTKND